MEQEVFVHAYEVVRPIVLKAVDNISSNFGTNQIWNKRL